MIKGEKTTGEDHEGENCGATRRAQLESPTRRENSGGLNRCIPAPGSLQAGAEKAAGGWGR